MSHDANTPQETVRISVMVPRDLHRRLSQKAESEERTFSGQLRLALAEHLDRDEEPVAA